MMLSPKQVVQPTPRYPALCRQDTTSPWSSDYGRNIYNLTQILMPTIFFGRNIPKKSKRRNTVQKKKKMEKKKQEKHESEISTTWTTLNLKLSLKKIVLFCNKNFSTFLRVLASARTTGKRKRRKKEKMENKRKDNIGKTKNNRRKTDDAKVTQVEL